MPSWTRAAAKLRPERLKLPVIAWEIPCAGCKHVRSSHLKLVLFGHCKVSGCRCLCFDAMCGCGHLLSGHMFGTKSDNWRCDMFPCMCQGFGAKQEKPEIPGQMRLFD